MGNLWESMGIWENHGKPPIIPVRENSEVVIIGSVAPWLPWLPSWFPAGRRTHITTVKIMSPKHR